MVDLALTPVTGHIGAIVEGVDLRRLDDASFDAVYAALLEHQVLFFREAHLDDEEHMALAHRFGQPSLFPLSKLMGATEPELQVIHDGPDSAPETDGWHTDVTWMEQPSLGSIAQCVETPPVGGDTLFSDSHACYLGLPGDLQARIEYLAGINDYRLFLFGLDDDLIEAVKADIPFGVSHPLVRTHPETGKPALYIHGGFLRHDDRVRRLVRQPCGGMGVLLAYRLRRDEPVAEPRRQRVDRALQGLRFGSRQIARNRCRHVKFPPGFSRPWQSLYKGSREPDLKKVHARTPTDRDGR